MHTSYKYLENLPNFSFYFDIVLLQAPYDTRVSFSALLNVQKLSLYR